MATDLLFNLFKNCQERTNDTAKNFEDHFTWLDEYIVKARESFAHDDPVLPSMTPAAKKSTRKRPINKAIKDDSDEHQCPPSKRPLFEESSEEIPRRGRAASKAAQQKIKCGIAKENFKGKLRRPSSPEINSNITIKSESEEKKEKESLVSVQSHNRFTSQIKENRASASYQESSVVKTPVKQCPSEVTPMSTPSPTVNAKNQDTPRKNSIGHVNGSVSFMDVIKETDDSQDEPDTGPEEEPDTGPEVDHIVTDNSEDETEGKETDSMEDEPVEMSILQLNETEVHFKLNENEVVSKLNETEVICRLDETEVIETNEGTNKLNETVVISKHNETGVGSKLNETEVVTLTLTSDEDQKSEVEITESETENVNTDKISEPEENMPETTESEDVNNDKISECEENMPPPVEAPKSRTTRTKTKGKKSEPRKTEVATSEDEVINIEAPKSRSTRTKKKNVEENQSDSTEDNIVPNKTEVATSEDEVIVNAPKSRSTRTKKKNADELQVNTEDIAPPSPKPRSTRTKKRQLEEEKLQPEPTPRSTRTKKKKEEEKAPEPHEESGFQLALSDSEDEGVGESLDGKEVAINSTFVKSLNNRNHSMESVSSEVSTKSEDSSSKEPEVAQPPKRMTRSKVRPPPPVRDLSPKKTESCHSPRNNRASRTPVKQTLAKTPNMQYSPRPFTSKTGSVKKMAEAYQNYFVESEHEEPENSQSPRVAKHSKGTSKKSTTGAKNNTGKKIPKSPPKTPDCSSDKVHPRAVPMTGGRVTPSQSGRITPKSFSRVKPIVSAYSSTSENRTKKVFTPTEVKRTKSVLGTTPNEMKRPKNIISGVTSFIKIQPSKPSRDEIEERKREDLRKKKEREEEGKRKRDEMITKKMEDQKRRNEERMRKVQEARAERERKTVEAKQQQDNEKKIREERLKEEHLRKKQQAIAKKKADEELRLQQIREQQEEEEKRRKEEERRKIAEAARIAEEARKAEVEQKARIAEEARKAEAERKARIAEQRRIHEEKQKRTAEAERIARERQEVELLRQREDERSSAQKKNQNLNETYSTQDDKENSTAHNSTYIKPTSSANSSNQKTERNDSYDMTPDRKPPPKKKTGDANCYDINDIGSSDSTDDETQPKKKIPSWAQGTNLKAALVNQEYFPPDVISIFPPHILLQMPELSEMFPIQRRRFHKRGSSAIWNTPPSKLWAS